jgi:hypothetical protein
MVDISHDGSEGLFSNTRVLGALIAAMLFGLGMMVGHAL